MDTSIPSNANNGCVGPASNDAGKADSCSGCPNQSACSSGSNRGVGSEDEIIKARLFAVKHKILVLSGKGGVG